MNATAELSELESVRPAEFAGRAFWGVMISFVVHGLVVSTWVSRIASIKTLLRMGDGALGLALLGTAIGSIAAIPVCGGLVTRFGSRNIVRWTGVGFCLVMILPAVAWNWWTLFIALLSYGAFAGANDVAINAQAVGTERLLGSSTMSRFHAMFSLGGIAGATAGALIASTGLPPLAHFLAAASVCLCFAFLGPRWMADTRQTVSGRAHASFRNIPPSLVALSAIGFCIFLSEGAIADWTGVYLKQVLHASDGLAPMGYAVFSAAMAIFRFAGDAIIDRIGRVATIRIGGLLAAGGIALAVASQSTALAMVGFAAAGAGFSSIIPIVFAAGGRINSLAEGAGVATVSGIGYLGFLAGPPAIGFISEMGSLRLGLALLAILSLSATVLVGVLDRSDRTILR